MNRKEVLANKIYELNKEINKLEEELEEEKNKEIFFLPRDFEEYWSFECGNPYRSINDSYSKKIFTLTNRVYRTKEQALNDFYLTYGKDYFKNEKTRAERIDELIKGLEFHYELFDKWEREVSELIENTKYEVSYNGFKYENYKKILSALEQSNYYGYDLLCELEHAIKDIKELEEERKEKNE